MKCKCITGKIKIRELIFVIAWSMFILTVILQGTIWYVDLDSSFLITLFKGIRYASYLLCVFIIIKNSLSNKILIGIILLLGCLGLCMVGSTNRTMFLYSFLIFASYRIDSRLIIKVALFWQVIVLFITIWLSQIGVIKDFLFGEDVRPRHGLGFCWAAIAPIMYFYCMLQYIYLRKNKITLIEFAVMEFLNIVLFKLTDARLAFYLSTIFLFIFFIASLIKNSNQNKKLYKLKKCLCALPAFIAVFSIGIHALYNDNDKLFSKINILLSKRLALGHQAIADYGLSIFGQKIEWIGFSSKPIQGTYNYVDCSYLQLAIEYGIIFLIVIVFIYSIVLWKAIKINDNYLIMILCIILVFGITEPRLMNFAYNPFPLMLFANVSAQNYHSGHRQFEYIPGRIIQHKI